VLLFIDVARYKGLKGKYWTYFSEYVRRRDFIQFGSCISCGKPVSDWRQFDAGHFISAGGGGFALLFDERNVNGECQYDNAFNQNHLLLYRRGLDARYGPGTADALEERYRDSHFKGTTTKEWSKREYEAKIEEIKGKLAMEA
jgi:Bacteriophage Lambda NinG protein